MTQKEIKKIQRIHEEIMDYLAANNRTYQDEYALIENKQSKLTKSYRDYVTMLVVYDQYKSNEVTPTDDTNNVELNNALQQGDRLKLGLEGC